MTKTQIQQFFYRDVYFDNPNMGIHLKRVAPVCTDYMCV